MSIANDSNQGNIKKWMFLCNGMVNHINYIHIFCAYIRCNPINSAWIPANTNKERYT